MENGVNGGEVNEDVGENAPVVINDNGVQAVSQNGVLVGGEIVGEPPVQAGIEDIDAAELQILNNIQEMVVEEVVLGFILGLNENVMAEVALEENVAVEESVASSVEAAVVERRWWCARTLRRQFEERQEDWGSGCCYGDTVEH